MTMTARRTQNPIVCPGHSRPIVELNFSCPTPDGLFLVSASKDGCPMLRNGETGDWIGTFEGHKGAVWSAALNSPALLAATGSADFTARVWDAVTGDEMAQFQHKHIVRSVRFAKLREKLATAGAEKIIRIFDLENPQKDAIEFPVVPHSIHRLLWCKEDSLILSSFNNEDGISVWDVRSNAIVKTLSTTGPSTSLELSSNGQIVTSAEGNHIRFWDISKLELHKEFDLGFKIECASLNSQDSKFVIGGEDMSVRLFDFKTGEEIEKNCKHHGPVHTIQFSPAGDTYASGSEDGTIRLWETFPNLTSSEMSNRNGNVTENVTMGETGTTGSVEKGDNKINMDKDNEKTMEEGTTSTINVVDGLNGERDAT